MDNAFSLDKALIGQSLRAAYHDSGTYNQHERDGGGANGCLMNASEDMIDDAAGENKGLEGPMKVLRVSYIHLRYNVSYRYEAHSYEILSYSLH